MYEKLILLVLSLIAQLSWAERLMPATGTIICLKPPTLVAPIAKEKDGQLTEMKGSTTSEKIYNYNNQQTGDGKQLTMSETLSLVSSQISTVIVHRGDGFSFYSESLAKLWDVKSNNLYVMLVFKDGSYLRLLAHEESRDFLETIGKNTKVASFNVTAAYGDLSATQFKVIEKEKKIDVNTLPDWKEELKPLAKRKLRLTGTAGKTIFEVSASLDK